MNITSGYIKITYDNSSDAMGFVDSASLMGIDYQASLQKFEKQILEAIHTEFPTYTIEISAGYGNIYTQDLDDEDVRLISEILGEVWEKFDWLVTY